MHVIEHTYISLLADVARLTGFSEIRGSYEGLQWAVTTAPKLEKHILSVIEEGITLNLDLFPGWLQRLARGAVTDPLCMRYLRQLLLFCYKAEVTHDKQTTANAFETFYQTNSEIGEWGASLSRQTPLLFDSARRHCQSVLYRLRGKDINPSHGPGSSTTPKGRWTHSYPTIGYVYGSDYHTLYFNQDHHAQLEEAIHDAHIECKLIAVPKDSRGPRLICVHPAEALWIQQGLRRALERAISLERSSNGPWPRGHIHFDDQSVNGGLALSSSANRLYSTIDLKEASDRISEPLVQALFGRYYRWFGCCRAQKVISAHRKGAEDINCYAPMGNATTFPVQSLVFWSICVAVLQHLRFHQPGAVFVFGDDILVPTETSEAVINGLESFGLLVNRNKSFYRGAFRESCGVDAFNGVDVTPLRWKTTLDAEHLKGMQSCSNLAMRLRTAEYYEAASTIYENIRKRLAPYGLRLPLTDNPDHGGIAEFGRSSDAWSNAYWHEDSHQFVTPVLRLQERVLTRTHHDWNHVLESVCSLERTGRSSIPDRDASRRLRLVRGWMPLG